MKRVFFFLVVVFLCLGCKNTSSGGGKQPHKDDWSNAKVGDKGAGGGIIFHIEEGKIWEVSEDLEKKNWEEAKTSCEGYRGGNFSDWYLPSKDELNWVYEALVPTAKIENAGYYWSSTPDTDDKAWEQNFFSGAQDSISKDQVNKVRAVRTFTP